MHKKIDLIAIKLGIQIYPPLGANYGASPSNLDCRGQGLVPGLGGSSIIVKGDGGLCTRYGILHHAESSFARAITKEL